MPLISAGGIQINYIEKGRGFPIILLHGLSDDCNLWTPLLPGLSERYRTVAIDLRGHGLSSRPDERYTIRRFSQDLSAFMQKMEIDKAHLMGLSMGAAVAQQFALDHPKKTRSLVLLSAFARADPHFKEKLTDLRENLVEGGVPDFFDEAVRLVVTPEFRAANSAAIADSKIYAVRINSAEALIRAIDACLEFDLRDSISKISAPVLILSGREDVFTRLTLAEEIHKSITGSTWTIMEGVGHNLFTPENVPPLLRRVLDFLAFR